MIKNKQLDALIKQFDTNPESVRAKILEHKDDLILFVATDKDCDDRNFNEAYRSQQVDEMLEFIGLIDEDGYTWTLLGHWASLSHQIQIFLKHANYHYIRVPP